MSSPLSVCLITREFLGAYEATHIGATLAGFAQETAALGHAVTVLLVPPYEKVVDTRASDITALKSYYLNNYCIQVEVLTGSEEFLPGLNNPAKASLAAYHYLRRHRFDSVYFALEGGLGYYSILGREVGLTKEPALTVLGQDPLAFEAQADRFFLRNLKDVETAYMERYAAENCNCLLLASEELERFLTREGWSLPRNARLLPNFLPSEWRSAETVKKQRSRITELVFFGGSSFRKGLTLFCDALDRLAERDLPPLKVTLLGPFDRILGEHTGGMMLRRARTWPFVLNLLPNVTPQECVAYLASRDCLVVSPAFAAASPYDVLLCLQEGIPFVATDVGGIPDMIADCDRRSCLTAPNPKSIADTIESVVLSGARAVRPAMSEKEKRQALADCISAAPKADAVVAAAPGTAEASVPARSRQTRKRRPLVSVVMAHHDRPDLVLQAISSVERQSYKNLELILVDDGSVKGESLERLDELEPKFSERGWKILREPNRYLGAARNAGVKSSAGQRILFLDDDNILFDQAVSTFVAAMDHSGADICCCLSRILYGRAAPKSPTRGLIQYFPLGGSLDLGLLHNSFGDANAMIRRDVFHRIGYLNEEYGFVAQDWEFFARAVFEGLTVKMIPEALYLYRSDPQAMYRSSHWWSTRQTILDLYRKKSAARLDYLYDLVLAGNVDPSDTEAYHHNLLFSPSDLEHVKLRKFDPNAEGAKDLLIEIAASEGRPETALALIGQRKREGAAKTFVDSYVAARPEEQIALAEATTRLTDSRVLTASQMREAEVRSSLGDRPAAYAYTEEPDRLYLEAGAGLISVAVLTAYCSSGVTSVSALVYLDEAEVVPTDFMLLLIPPDDDPLEAVGRAQRSKEGSSGWCRVSRPYETRLIEAALEQPCDRPRTLVFALRPALGQTKGTLGCFSYICEKRVLSVEPSLHRPRRGASPQRQRAHILKLETASLLTKGDPQQAALEFLPGDKGLLLRPLGNEVVVATLPWAFSPFARKVVATVEVAQVDGPDVSFATALVRPDHIVRWTSAGPSSSVAYSGWHKVSERFELQKFHVTIPTPTRTHLALHLAVRCRQRQETVPPSGYWRKLVLAWD